MRSFEKLHIQAGEKGSSTSDWNVVNVSSGAIGVGVSSRPTAVDNGVQTSFSRRTRGAGADGATWKRCANGRIVAPACQIRAVIPRCCISVSLINPPKLRSLKPGLPNPLFNPPSMWTSEMKIVHDAAGPSVAVVFRHRLTHRTLIMRELVAMTEQCLK